MNFTIYIGRDPGVDRKRRELEIIRDNFIFSTSNERWISHSSFNDTTLIVVGYVTEYAQQTNDLHMHVRDCANSNNHGELKKLSGNYALIFHCKKTNKVILSGDISGCIPIYTRLNNNRLVVTTSIQNASNISRTKRINKSAFLASLSYISLKPHETMLADIERINPEQVVVFCTQTASIKQRIKFSFHKLIYNPDYKRLEEEEVAELVKSWLMETSLSLIHI